MGQKDGHNSDLKFMQRIKDANLNSLFNMLQNHSHKNAPEWKRIAIERAIVRNGGRLPMSKD